MASTSPVRIRREDKDRIEALQRELQALSGDKPTQQETVGKIVAFAVRHKDDFLAEATWRPRSDEEIAYWESLAEDLGDWTTDDIDEIVYGGAA